MLRVNNEKMERVGRRKRRNKGRQRTCDVSEGNERLFYGCFCLWCFGDVVASGKYEGMTARLWRFGVRMTVI
jgi:hypothetical protein